VSIGVVSDQIAAESRSYFQSLNELPVGGEKLAPQVIDGSVPVGVSVCLIELVDALERDLLDFTPRLGSALFGVADFSDRDAVPGLEVSDEVLERPDTDDVWLLEFLAVKRLQDLDQLVPRLVDVFDNLSSLLGSYCHFTAPSASCVSYWWNTQRMTA
jgi:hypothetical protein